MIGTSSGNAFVRTLSGPRKKRPMLAEEPRIRRNCVRRQVQLLSFKSGERIIDELPRQPLLQSPGQKEAEFIIERNQVLVESRIVQAGEANPVADIESFALVVCPGEYVRGDEEFT